VFISISAVGLFWLLWVLPETKGLPLEEIAALMGDPDQVVVYQHDIRVDEKTHEVVLEVNEDGINTENLKGGTFSRVFPTHNMAEGV
jgi:hypothetical protein